MTRMDGSDVSHLDRSGSTVTSSPKIAATLAATLIKGESTGIRSGIDGLREALPVTELQNARVGELQSVIGIILVCPCQGAVKTPYPKWLRSRLCVGAA